MFAIPQHIISGTSANLVTVSSTGAIIANTDVTKSMFHAGIVGITPVATPTDFIQMIGSSTMTCRIKYISMNGVATANGNMAIYVIRRKTAGTIGSAVVTAITPSRMDINDAAPTMSVGYVGTANWGTVGSTNGVVSASRLFLATTATGVTAPTVFNFCLNEDKGLVLRGTSDYVYVNLNGGTVPSGGAIDFEVCWEEAND